MGTLILTLEFPAIQVVVTLCRISNSVVFIFDLTVEELNQSSAIISSSCRNERLPGGYRA